MQLPAFADRRLPWLAAFAALLAAGLLVPTPAKAGCTAHYVTERGRVVSPLHDLEILRLPGDRAFPQDEAPRPKHEPCTGAFCSGNPAPPPSTEPGTPHSRIEFWALLTTLPTLNASRPLLLPPFDSGLRPIDVACSIFHPPRTTPSLKTS